MNVAIICEFSGTVRDSFIKRGHNAISYDLLPSDSPGPHVIGDVRDSDLSWADLVIAHPPCTRLCNSGVRWLHERNLWKEMQDAADFFVWCMNQGRFNATENPVMHKYAISIVGRKADQIVQPWQHGDGYTKATGFWLRGLPPLQPTNIVSGRKPEVHFAAPGPDRWKLRSKTYQGIADTIAEQWGDYVSKNG